MEMNQIKTVIFDMDGVIIDSEPIHRNVEQEIFTSLGLHISEKEHLKYTGTSSLEMWADIIKTHHLEKSPEEVANQNHQEYIRKLKSMDKLPAIDGVADFIKNLHKSGYTLVLASSSAREQIEMIVESLEIKSYFEVLVSGAELPKSKPDPMIFLKAAQLTRTPPNQCCVIEDSFHGVTAAKAAGMTCIGFRNPNSGNQDLSEADVTISRFDEADEISFFSKT